MISISAVQNVARS